MNKGLLDRNKRQVILTKARRKVTNKARSFRKGHKSGPKLPNQGVSATKGATILIKAACSILKNTAFNKFRTL
ncbi:hypothetical protein GCM10011391_38410 [Pullulanibacillus camelliae]|uniref:Uncharacterized protein n=1 Tax=Pullulanibacillus camelliae TaxID=1707096 RepID=A0A8J3E225_9BACL|nr:hypothetical protein GCM10011391_38410 [Pullulanibacillus camelliae]